MIIDKPKCNNIKELRSIYNQTTDNNNIEKVMIKYILGSITIFNGTILPVNTQTQAI